MGEWTRLDVVFLLYCFSNVITYVLLWAGDSGAIINRLGFLYNSCTMYFFVRFTVRTRVDLTLAIKALVWVFARSRSVCLWNKSQAEIRSSGSVVFRSCLRYVMAKSGQQARLHIL